MKNKQTEKKTVINVENISKKFKIGKKKNPALAIVLSLLKKKGKSRELRVLDSISFQVMEGEIFGVIGRNGSGKSTLLRTIAGIYLPDSGNIETNGKVFYLSGLDAGLTPKLTMRENIFLVCSILGLTKSETNRIFDKIVEFSGLKTFLDTEVEKFSSGMTSRLNYSITIHCLEHHDPDILLLDEVFGAGGDANFQEKATAKMEELIKGGATVILVSHSLDVIEKHCHRAILLEQGRILKEDTPKKVIEEYSSICAKVQH